MPESDDIDDVVVTDTPDRSYFIEKSRCTPCADGERRLDDFQGDRLSALQVVGPEDSAHSAGTDVFQSDVAAVDERSVGWKCAP